MWVSDAVGVKDVEYEDEGLGDVLALRAVGARRQGDRRQGGEGREVCFRRGAGWKTCTTMYRPSADHSRGRLCHMKISADRTRSKFPVIPRSRCRWGRRPSQ